MFQTTTRNKKSTRSAARPKAIVTALLCAAAYQGPLGARSARAADVTQGKLETFYVTTSLVRPIKHDGKRDILIYTPAGYSDPANAGRKYPVVYLLHGSPGNPFNFVKYGDFPARIEDAVRRRVMQPIILVAPNGNYVGQKQGDSEWADSADRRDRFETWITREVVPWVDSRFRTRAEPSGRYLAGVSEGGFGSVNLLLRNPRIFGGAVGLSGYYDMRGFGWGHIIMNDSDAAMSLNSPLYYVPERATAGRAGEWSGLHVFVGAGAEEKPYAAETQQIGDALKAAGVRDVTVRLSNGKHDWNLWSSLFFEGMAKFLPPVATAGTH